MSGDETTRAERRLADAMAAFDDGLAAGRETPTDELGESVDADVLPEWERLAAFLTLVELAWPRDAAHADSWTEPARTGPVEPRAGAGTGPPEVASSPRFGRFQIRQTLGQGGFGIVFLAWDPALRREVALKVPQPESLVTPEARKRFLREAHAAATLDHPNIVPVYESGSVGTVAYIASAFCPGPTLAGWLARQSRPLPARDAVILIAKLARAVEHAHERGVVHRDLKPSNVLLQGLEADVDDAQTNSLSGFQPRITDFSLAWLADGQGPKTRSGVPIGSPPYMAPEQAEGRLKAIGPPTDVYGLGSILYELLTACPPFRGESQLEILKQVTDDDPIPPRRLRKDIPIEVESIVLKCLEKDPARRYLTAGALADDLDRFLAGEPTKARPPGAREKIRRAAKRHPAASVIVTLAVLFAGTLLGGKHWFENRLNDAQHASRLLEADVRDRALAARRAQYVADIRQAAQLLRKPERNLATDLLERNRPRPGETEIRGFAWYFLRGLCNTERLSLFGHRGEVYHAEFSPDGRLLASSGQDGMVRLWDPTTGSLIRKIRAHESEVNWVAFAPNGKTLATTSDDGSVKLWDTETGLKRLEVPAHRGIALIVLFTPDGKYVISCGREDGDVKIWDAISGLARGSFHAADSLLENMALSPDGSILAVVSGSSIAGLWDLASRRCLTRLDHPRSGAMGVAFSHDGKVVATGGMDEVVRIWEVRGGSILRQFAGHGDDVQSVAFTSDDTTLVSAGNDNTVRLWDVVTGAPRAVLMGHSGRIWSVSISPDGRTIASASGDGTVKLWDSLPSDVGTRILAADKLVALTFAADGRTLIAAGADGLVSRWDVESNRLLDPIRIADIGSPVDVVLSRDGGVAAVKRKDGFIEIHDLMLHRRLNTIGPVAARGTSMELDLHGGRLAVTEEGEGVSLWERMATKRSAFLRGNIGRIVFDPNGEIRCSADDGKKRIIWNPTKDQTREGDGCEWHSYHFACFSPDGSIFAYSHGDFVLLWKGDSIQPFAELHAPRESIKVMAFSPDDKVLACGDERGPVKLWQIDTLEEVLTLKPPGDPVRLLSFSPNGKILAACTERSNGTSEIYLWRAAANDVAPAKGPEGTRSP